MQETPNEFYSNEQMAEQHRAHTVHAINRKLSLEQRWRVARQQMCSIEKMERKT